MPQGTEQADRAEEGDGSEAEATSLHPPAERAIAPDRPSVQEVSLERRAQLAASLGGILHDEVRERALALVSQVAAIRGPQRG